MTPKKGWREDFLGYYAESGNLSASARKAGATKQAVYDAKKRSKKFAEQVDAAKAAAADELEGVAFDRAKDHSDTMLIFLLKGLKPETYGDRIRHGGDPDNPIQHAIQPATVDLIEQMAAFKRSEAISVNGHS